MTPALEVAVSAGSASSSWTWRSRVESGMSVLFGPSGAGKSLTLALIAGLIRPDTGTIVINGLSSPTAPAGIYVSTQARRIGMVFQDGLLLPHRSVLDNVALAVRQASGRRARRAVARSWLERVGAEDSPTGDRARSRAASASGWRWRAASPAIRHWYCSTNRSPRSTPPCAVS